MNTSDRIKAVGATLVVGSLLAIALAATAQAGPGAPGMSPQVVKSVQARGEAMNRYYHLGTFSPATVAQQRAEERRGQAMNRHYNLGAFSPAAVAQQRAEERRAQAMNKYYGLGGNVTTGSSSRFDRSDVFIGAGALLIAIMVAGGLTVVLRRHPLGNVSSPSTP